MKPWFTPLRMVSVAGLVMLLALWVAALLGLMANTRLGLFLRHGEVFARR